MDREELEAKVTALLLGELPEGEAALMRELIARDPSLARLRDQLSFTLELVRQTAAEPNPAPSEPLKLSAERRENLLASFKTVKPQEFEPRKSEFPWLASVTMGLVGLLAVAAILPHFARARSTSQQNAVLNNLRLLDAAKQQWALEKGKPASAAPTMRDLQPYLGRGTGGELPGAPGETYFVGSVSQRPAARFIAKGGKETVVTIDGAASDLAAAPLEELSATAKSKNGPTYVAGAGTLLADNAGKQVSETDARTRSSNRADALDSLSVASAQPTASEISVQSVAGSSIGTPSVLLQSSPAATPPVALGVAAAQDQDQERQNMYAQSGSTLERESMKRLPIALPQSSNAADSADAKDFGLRGALARSDTPAKSEAGQSVTPDNSSAYYRPPSSQELSRNERERAPGRPADINTLQNEQQAGAPSAVLELPKKPWELPQGRAEVPAQLQSRALSYSQVGAVSESAATASPSLPSPSAAPREYKKTAQQSTRQLLDKAGEIAASEGISNSLGRDVVDESAANANSVNKKADVNFANGVVGGVVALSGPQSPPAEQTKLQSSEALNERTDAPLPQPALPPSTFTPETQTRSNSFSTFSLNVSDASFKLAAAALANNSLPEPASIRSEEFINAFDYRDPEPAAGAPISFNWERAQYPFAHNRDLLRFAVKTPALGREAGRPLNLVLLLDKSGSMERADRVAIVREALRALASQLTSNDTFSVVIFARTARLWLDGVPGNQAAEAANRLDSITPDGGTNLEDAMKLARETALRHYLANGGNRIVLMTDGAANLGNVDPEALKRKAESNRKQGISFDCFGVGWEGYNDSLMEGLSRAGNGRYGFINTPEEAATEFAGKLAGALRVAVADVKVQVEFNPGRVSAWRQIGYDKHQLAKEQFRDNSVVAAQIGAAESGNALYVIETNPNGEGPLCTVRIRFHAPGSTDVQERAWEIPWAGPAAPLEKAGPAMRLAATSGAFAEWLAGSPFAGEISPSQLLSYLRGVPEIYGADGRAKNLEWMLRQAKNVTGK